MGVNNPQAQKDSAPVEFSGSGAPDITASKKGGAQVELPTFWAQGVKFDPADNNYEDTGMDTEATDREEAAVKDAFAGDPMESRSRAPNL